jgi:succinate dehydrogenase / fumarate reductase cytochrome b subunit
MADPQHLAPTARLNLRAIRLASSSGGIKEARVDRKDLSLANVRNTARPLSPHLGIYTWGPHMAVSILHRATGSGMATVGTGLFVWWLVALAYGPDAYATFLDVFTLSNGKLNILGYIVGIGMSLSFFQHMASGVRHLFLDAGANFELRANKRTALTTFAVSILATAIFWVVLLEKANG